MTDREVPAAVVASGEQALAALVPSLGPGRHVAKVSDLALRRLLLAHLLVLGYGGLPPLWTGDELALLDDARWEDDLDALTGGPPVEDGPFLLLGPYAAHWLVEA